MPESVPPCPECLSEHTYAGPADAPEPRAHTVLDAVGNALADGDSVIVTTSIKVAGAARPIKAGTKVRNIRLIEPVNGHDIDCRVDGFGAMLLKSSLVKRA